MKLFSVFCRRFIPETPRWLLSHGKLDEAHGVLMKCADKNSVDSEEIRTILKVVQENEKQMAMTKQKVSPLDLIKTAKMRRRSLIVAFNW